LFRRIIHSIESHSTGQGICRTVSKGRWGQKFFTEGQMLCRQHVSKKQATASLFLLLLPIGKLIQKINCIIKHADIAQCKIIRLTMSTPMQGLQKPQNICCCLIPKNVFSSPKSEVSRLFLEMRCWSDNRLSMYNDIGSLSILQKPALSLHVSSDATVVSSWLACHLFDPPTKCACTSHWVLSLACKRS